MLWRRPLAAKQEASGLETRSARRELIGHVRRTPAPEGDQSKEQVSREDAAQRLIALGQALASGETLDIGAGDQQRSVRVADTLRGEYETKSRGDRVEIEVELTWDQGGSTSASLESDEEADSPAIDQDAPTVEAEADAPAIDQEAPTLPPQA